MTAHVHDPAAHGGGTPARHSAGAASTASARPRWLLPGLLTALVAGGLVFLGVLSLSTVLYAGLFGGMMLMHMGGHGHGGHGGGGTSRGHSMHGDRTGDAEDLSRRSSDAQPSEPDSTAGLDQRARDNSTTSETDDHDQNRAHGCH